MGAPRKETGAVPAALAALALAIAAHAAAAQTSELEFDRPESWGMKYSASIALFTGLGVPEPMDAGAFVIGLEGANIPQVSDEKRRIGFNGTKQEDMNKSRVFGRARARLGLGSGWSAELGFVPPVTVGGAQPLMVGAAIGGVLVEQGGVRVGVRAHGQWGRVKGDITCDKETVAAGLGSAANPFDCEAISEDEVTHRYGGIELSAALPQGSWEPYLAVSGNYVDSEFQVNARYSGVTTTELLKTSGTTISGAAGLAVELTDQVRVHVEGFFTPLDVVRPPPSDAPSQREGLFNVRAMVSYRVN